MNSNESKVKSLLKTIVTAMADSGNDDWPPKCSALLYQPVHPCASESQTQIESSTSEKTVNN